MNTLLLLSVAQIVIESLPVSSSAHVNLLEYLLKHAGISGVARPEVFDHILHVPTIVVVSAFLLSTYASLVVRGGVALLRPHRSLWRVRILVRAKAMLLAQLLLATLLTACFYFSGLSAYLHSIVPPHLLYAAGFLWTALLFLRLTALPVDARASNGFVTACVVGCAQGLALLPGVSRLGSTYCAARIMGLRPRQALSYSLLLQLILMLAGGVKALCTPLGKQAFAYLMIPHVALCVGVAAVGAFFLLRLVSSMAHTRTMYRWGYYLLCMAALSFALL